MADTPATRRYDLTDEEFALIQQSLGAMLASLADIEHLHDSSQKQAFIRNTIDQLATFTLGPVNE